MYTKEKIIDDFNNSKAEKTNKSSAWLITFADLSLLLLTFFIILLTFANINVKKFKELIDSVQIYFGVSNNNTADISKKDITIDLVTKKHTLNYNTYKKPNIIDKYSNDMKVQFEFDKMLLNLMGYLEKNKLKDAIEYKRGDNGVKLRITEKVLFDQGEAMLKGDLVSFLDMLANMLLENDYYLVVEGHTDNVPITSSAFPSNWELSSARASIVIRYLVERGVSQDKLTGIGYSSNFPLVPNNSPENRAKNRRVEMILTNKPTRVMVD